MGIWYSLKGEYVIGDMVFIELKGEFDMGDMVFIEG